MRRFAMVLVAISALMLIVNCAKKEEVVQQPAAVVETPVPAVETPAVVDSTVAVVDSAAVAAPTEKVK